MGTRTLAQIDYHVMEWTMQGAAKSGSAARLASSTFANSRPYIYEWVCFGKLGVATFMNGYVLANLG